MNGRSFDYGGEGGWAVMQLEDESFLSSNHSNPMRQASREWKTFAKGKVRREAGYL